MTQHRMSPPGPIWSALTPNERSGPSEYESRLRMMPRAQVFAEYEMMVAAFEHGEAALWLKVIESRRECQRRMGVAA
jgi:hypothetical protein